MSMKRIWCKKRREGENRKIREGKKAGGNKSAGGAKGRAGDRRSQQPQLLLVGHRGKGCRLEAGRADAAWNSMLPERCERTFIYSSSERFYCFIDGMWSRLNAKTISLSFFFFFVKANLLSLNPHFH